MLVIGHRGAADLAPENTLEAMQAGFDFGADILEFDVQATRDGMLLVVHDSTLMRTHQKRTIVRWSTHESIKLAAEKGHKIATLKEVLDLFFGKILLNLEIKNRNTGKRIAEYIKKHYIKKPSDWQNILFSSFKPSELKAVRKVSPHAELAMLHYRNPFGFIAYQRGLQLAAVGFHRLYVASLPLEIAKQLGLFTYVYTVNRGSAAKRFYEQGIDGIVTDNPKAVRSALSAIL